MSTRLRSATPEDYLHFARWFPMLETGDDVASCEVWDQRIRPTTTIAEIAEAPAGYCYTETYGEDGYVRHLVVDPQYRREGVGRALLRHAGLLLRAAGATRWRLNVRLDNVAAIALYREMGLSISHHGAAVRFPWTLLDGLAEPDSSLRVVAPDTAQAHALETHFELPRGQLAAAAARSSTVVCAAVGDRLLAVTSFDTSAGNAFPFRVETIDAAMALLFDLRSRAPAASEVMVVIEAHEELETLLLGGGARLVLRFAQMRGPL